MINPVSNATQSQPVANTNAKQPAPQGKQSRPSSDTVTLSNAAQALAATLQEARETAFQTSTEAGKGDIQAKRLLAAEAAAKPVSK